MMPIFVAMVQMMGVHFYATVRAIVTYRVQKTVLVAVVCRSEWDVV